MRKFIIILFLAQLFSSITAKNHIVLADSSEISTDKNDIRQLVKDTTFDIKLLEPIFEKERIMQASLMEREFLYRYINYSASYFRSQFTEGKVKRDEYIISTIKKRSQILLSYILNSNDIIYPRTLKKMPVRCDKELALMNAAIGQQQRVEADVEGDDQSQKLLLIIKEQREQINYLREQLKNCEESRNQ